MKILKSVIIIIITFVFYGCNEDDTNTTVEGVVAPTNVTANFNITQDDTGLVTITPSGNSVTSFQVFFGDIENESPTIVSPGNSAEHIYSEGTYMARIVGIGATGLTSEFLQDIVISFRTPENLIITVEKNAINPSIVTVGASADFATMFDVFFGDMVNEEPTVIMPGETVEHTYGSPGDYTIRVVARGAGIATVELTEIVTISAASDPIVLPIDFESFTINYGFVDFGGAASELIDNPNPVGINTSSKVGRTTKINGAETFAGTILQLGNPIDFTSNKLFKLKVFSPKSGITVKLKVENATDGNISFEVDAINTVVNDWEELIFDFSTINTSLEYQKVVVFFDFGVVGDDSQYLFDDIELVTTTLQQPTVAAPTPTLPPANTISMFSDVYTDVTVDTWRTTWSNTSFEDVTVAGNATKKYFDLGFVGIEATSFPIDASTMTHFSMDVWSANFTEFKIKLVDFGADGAFGGTDDVEHEITISSPAQGEWVSLDIPLSNFTGLTTRANIAQLIYSGSPAGNMTVFIDNIYFHN